MRLGEWMGLPTETQYENCERIYLDTENQVMKTILEHAENAPAREKIVIDTTGSVIHLEDAVLQKLKQLTKVVHLETSADVRAQMAEQYIRKPLAVVWRGRYSEREGESVEQALDRSYQELIHDREQLYSRLADLTIPYEQHRDKDFGISSLLG